MSEAQSGKVIKLGDNVIKIVGGDDVRPMSAVRDGDAPAEARITGRVRMSLPMAKDLMNFLQGVMATEMPGPERAN